MVKVLDPQASLYELDYFIHKHDDSFKQYCETEREMSLSCLLFFDVIMNMLQVSKEFSGKVMNYYIPFVTRLNEIFVINDFSTKSNKPEYISKLGNEQKELLSSIQVKIQAQLFNGLSQYLLDKVATLEFDYN